LSKESERAVPSCIASTFPITRWLAPIVHIRHYLEAAQCLLLDAEASAEANGEYGDAVPGELLDKDKLVLGLPPCRAGTQPNFGGPSS
jgi:hypothetical protein